jgi:hypothetical protein
MLKILIGILILLLPSVASADPISAVISIGGMMSATAGTMTLMKGITFVGSALSLAGNVTGNKKLMKIGNIAALAGGVGSWAQSRGLLGGTKAIAGAGGQTAAVGSQAAAPIDVSSAAGQQSALRGADATMAQARGGFSATAQPTPLGGGGMVNTAMLAPPAAPMPQAPVPPPSAFDKLRKGAGNVMDFANANPASAQMVASIGGGVADWLSGATDMELDEMRANIDYSDARAAQIQMEIDDEKRRRKTLNEGYAQVKLPQLSVNRNANMQMNPFNAGLVAGNMG